LTNSLFPILIVLIFVLFFGGRFIYRKFQERRKLAELQTLVGEVGMLISGIRPPDQWGSVRIGDEIWRAESQSGEPVGAGQRVRITAVKENIVTITTL